MINQYRT